MLTLGGFFAVHSRAEILKYITVATTCIGLKENLINILWKKIQTKSAQKLFCAADLESTACQCHVFAAAIPH